jgi:hypothetical protein
MEVAMTNAVRRWAAGVGLAGGALVAVGMTAPTACADTADELLGQAGADLTQAASVLDSAPTASLAPEGAGVEFLSGQQNAFDPALQNFLTHAEPLQADLPAADQTSPLLVDADQTLLQAYDGLLSVDQAFVAADQAGDYSSTASGSALEAGMQVINEGLPAAFAVIPAELDVLGTEVFAQLAADIGLSL